MKSAHPLTHPDVAANDPVDRSARQYFLPAPGLVARVNPVAAPLCGPCRADAAQIVDALDTDGKLQEMQRHRGTTTSGLSLAFGGGESDQLGTLFDLVADREPNRLDDAIGRRRDSVLHFHRLDDHQRLAAPDVHTGLDDQLRDTPRHRRGEPSGGRVLASVRGERIDLDEPPPLAFEENRDLEPMFEHRHAPMDAVDDNHQQPVEPPFSGDHYPPP